MEDTAQRLCQLYRKEETLQVAEQFIGFSGRLGVVTTPYWPCDFIGSGFAHRAHPSIRLALPTKRIDSMTAVMQGQALLTPLPPGTKGPCHGYTNS